MAATVAPVPRHARVIAIQRAIVGAQETCRREVLIVCEMDTKQESKCPAPRELGRLHGLRIIAFIRDIHAKFPWRPFTQDHSHPMQLENCRPTIM